MLPCVLQAPGRSPKPFQPQIAGEAALHKSAVAASSDGRWLARGAVDGSVTYFVDGEHWEDIQHVTDAASPVTALAWGPPPSPSEPGDEKFAERWPLLAAGMEDGAIAVHEFGYVSDSGKNYAECRLLYSSKIQS